MTDQQPRSDVGPEVKPHAYDPIAQPELFEGVLTRRVLAFIVDVLIITIPIMLVSIFIFLFEIIGKCCKRAISHLAEAAAMQLRPLCREPLRVRARSDYIESARVS